MHLSSGWDLFVEIADQSNPDPLFIHSSGTAMRAALLLDPTGSDFKLAIPFSQGAVVDQEMISEAIPETTVNMISMDGKGFADISGGMMDHDVFPAPIGIERDHIAQGFGIWDDQFLAGMNRISWSQRIRGIDRIQGNVIHPGEPPDGFQRSDLMGDSLANPGGVPPCFKHSGSRIGRQRRSSRGGKGPGRDSYRRFVATGSRDGAQKEEQDGTNLFPAPELNE